MSSSCSCFALSRATCFCNPFLFKPILYPPAAPTSNPRIRETNSDPIPSKNHSYHITCNPLSVLFIIVSVIISKSSIPPAINIFYYNHFSKTAGAVTNRYFVSPNKSRNSSIASNGSAFSLPDSIPPGYHNKLADFCGLASIITSLGLFSPCNPLISSTTLESPRSIRQ